jgi:hypothetical protein
MTFALPPILPLMDTLTTPAGPATEKGGQRGA